MSHEFILWIVLFAYAVHIVEERILLWLPWAKETFKLPLTWEDFYTANAAVLFSAFSAAMVGWRCVSFALIIAALMIINGLFFHIGPTIVKKQFSPGVITSVILFLPIGITSYYFAYLDGVLTWFNTILSFIFGWLLMSSLFIFHAVRHRLERENDSETIDRGI